MADGEDLALLTAVRKTVNRSNLTECSGSKLRDLTG